METLYILLTNIKTILYKKMSVDDLLFRLCVWHKSPSIVENNAQYERCHLVCNGYDHSCTYYIGKKEYLKAKIIACQKLNKENGSSSK